MAFIRVILYTRLTKIKVRHLRRTDDFAELAVHFEASSGGLGFTGLAYRVFVFREFMFRVFGFEEPTKLSRLLWLKASGFRTLDNCLVQQILI